MQYRKNVYTKCNTIVHRHKAAAINLIASINKAMGGISIRKGQGSGSMAKLLFKYSSARTGAVNDLH